MHENPPFRLELREVLGDVAVDVEVEDDRVHGTADDPLLGVLDAVTPGGE
jgi:hypothetical protein